MFLWGKTLVFGLCILIFMFFILSWVSASSLEEAHEAYRQGNWSQAAELYRPFAEKGNHEAQNNLGELYARGAGVRRDYYRAMELFRLAAAQGNVYAQTNLGLHYSQGLGVARDFDLACKWFNRAAMQGNFLAQNALGLYYLHGRSVDRDYVLAYKWFFLSAEQGFDQARQNMESTALMLNHEQLQTAKKMVEEFQSGLE